MLVLGAEALRIPLISIDFIVTIIIDLIVLKTDIGTISNPNAMAETGFHLVISGGNRCNPTTNLNTQMLTHENGIKYVHHNTIDTATTTRRKYILA
ncbi:hypothetical protein ES703_85396 [subsurface metagenome]